MNTGKTETVEVQKVNLIITASGDYCAFHEMSIRVKYDLTNDIAIDTNGETREELIKLVEEDDGDYTHYGECSGVLIDGTYYLDL